MKRRMREIYVKSSDPFERGRQHGAQVKGEIERVCVTVDFINACGTRTYIYNYFDIGSTNSGTYSTPKNSLSPK